MPTPNYEYDPETKKELERVTRKAFPPGISLKCVPLDEDFGGVDARYVVHHDCPLAFRVRRNRPAYASDEDITWRHTEPAMMKAGTYAPIAIFYWFNGLHIVAGWMVDVYHMVGKIDPPLGERPLTSNGDHTAFLTVSIGELHDGRALLKRWDGDTWSIQVLGGEARLLRILDLFGSP